MDRMSTDDRVIIALATLETKVDTLLENQREIADEIKTLDDDTGKRLSALEVSVAALDARVNSRLPWPGVAAAIVAIIGVALVVGERLFGGA
jgi:type VI protein secretion system component VasF